MLAEWGQAAIDGLAILFEPLRFIKHAQERRYLAERELREHTLELLDTMMQRSSEQQAHSAAVAMETAKSATALANALHTWFDMFKDNSAQEHLKSETVRSADEWSEEQQRTKRKLIEAGYPIDGSREDQLAYLLTMGDELPF